MIPNFMHPRQNGKFRTRSYDYEVQEFLFPVRKSLIYISLIAAVLINLMPFDKVILVLRPDFVALVLLYWNIYQPQQVGMSIAFVSGLFMDVIDISIMGQHAVAYCLITFLRCFCIGVYVCSTPFSKFLRFYGYSCQDRLLHFGRSPSWYVYSRMVCFFIQRDRSTVLAFAVFSVGKFL